MGSNPRFSSNCQVSLSGCKSQYSVLCMKPKKRKKKRFLKKHRKTRSCLPQVYILCKLTLSLIILFCSNKYNYFEPFLCLDLVGSLLEFLFQIFVIFSDHNLFLDSSLMCYAIIIILLKSSFTFFFFSHVVFCPNKIALI